MSIEDLHPIYSIQHYVKYYNNAALFFLITQKICMEHGGNISDVKRDQIDVDWESTGSKSSGMD